jgi:hypothetical protein
MMGFSPEKNLLTATGLVGTYLFSPQIQSALLDMQLPNLAKSVIVHPAGPFTVFFWAPAFKWALSGANLLDYKRPTNLISTGQQLALTATGLIWSRWSFVISPVNYNLAIVNIALAITGSYQLFRKVIHDPFPASAESIAAAKSKGVGH